MVYKSCYIVKYLIEKVYNCYVCSCVQFCFQDCMKVFCIKGLFVLVDMKCYML